MLSLVFIAVAAILLLAAFFAAYVVYDSYCLSRDGKERSFILFIGGMLLSGYLAVALIGAMVVNFVCPENSGAGCPFGVAVMSFPIFGGIGIAAFLFVWARSGHRVGKS